MRSILRPALTLALVMLLVPLSRAGTGQQENAVQVLEGQEPILLVYGDHTTGARIDQTTDFDTYEFDGQKDEVVQLRLDSLTNNVDPLIEVWGPNGFYTTKCCVPSSNRSCSIQLRFGLPENGRYTIVVSDKGVDEAGSYTLQIERIPSPLWEPPLIAYGRSFTDKVSPTTDADAFRFYGEADSLLRISVDGLTNNSDPHVEVFDPTGTSIGTMKCNPSSNRSCSFNMTVDLAGGLSGMYVVLVTDEGADENLDYRITVNCLVGCPPTTTWASHNGSGANPDVYKSVCPPAVGGTWVATIDTAPAPGSSLAAVFLYNRPLGTPVTTAWGEVLVDLASGPLGKGVRLASPDPTSGIARLEVKIPDMASLVGTDVSTQAALLGGGPVVLTNAIDYRLGR